MFVTIRFFVLLLIAENIGALKASNTVAESFKECNIVPHVISAAPNTKVVVNYPQAEVVLGNELSALQVTSQPTNISWESDKNEFYALVMIDPDVPVTGLVLHWLVVNIPGSDVAKGQTRAPYLSPTPAPATGKHRYIYLVYQQPAEICFDVIDMIEKSAVERLNFDINGFIEELDLGNPIAGNVFLSQMNPTPLPINDILAKKV